MSAVIRRPLAVVLVLFLALVSVAARGEPPDFERMRRQQAETDETWRAASDGFMRMEKITYRSRAAISTFRRSCFSR